MTSEYACIIFTGRIKLLSTARSGSILQSLQFSTVPTNHRCPHTPAALVLGRYLHITVLMVSVDLWKKTYNQAEATYGASGNRLGIVLPMARGKASV